MSLEDNKTLARRVLNELFNQKNLRVLDELFTADCVSHAASLGFPGGVEGTKALYAEYIKAFPDMQYKIEDLIAEDDKVAIRHTTSGTHRGTFMGIPATGRRVQFSGISILHVTNGRIAGHWDMSNVLVVMQQLGIVLAG